MSSRSASSKSAAKWVGGLSLATLAAALYWRRNPSPCPYSQRWAVSLPHPLITRSRLHETLVPQPGETILEVGPGTGYYTLGVARAVMPGGAVEALDIQEQMLALVNEKAVAGGVDNIKTTYGSAEQLPYADNSIDGAYLVTVLGEVPDRGAALRELARVLRPGGRVVVGEIFIDPHMVTLASLKQAAAAAGLLFERASGTRLAYFARLGVGG